MGVEGIVLGKGTDVERWACILGSVRTVAVAMRAGAAGQLLWEAKSPFVALFVLRVLLRCWDWWPTAGPPAMPQRAAQPTRGGSR